VPVASGALAGVPQDAVQDVVRVLPDVGAERSAALEPDVPAQDVAVCLRAVLPAEAAPSQLCKPDAAPSGAQSCAEQEPPNLQVALHLEQQQPAAVLPESEMAVSQEALPVPELSDLELRDAPVVLLQVWPETAQRAAARQVDVLQGAALPQGRRAALKQASPEQPVLQTV